MSNVNTILASARTHVEQLMGASDLVVSRITCYVLLGLWVIGLIMPEMAGKGLGLIPGNTLSNYYLWTFLTAGFLETSFAMGLINITLFILLAPSIERVWGSTTFVLYLCLTNVCIMVAVCAVMIVFYALTDNEVFLFRVVCGSSGMIAALLVAMKLRWPEQPVIPASILPVAAPFQLQHLPSLLALIAIVLWITGWMGGKEAPLIIFGILFGWLYLRFYVVDADTGVTGNMQPEFAFASLFPDVFGIRGMVNLIVTIPFHALMKAGFFAGALKSASAATQANSNSTELLTLLPTSAHSLSVSASAFNRPVDPQAERRRIMAIKAIDEKLAELAKSQAALLAGAQAGGGDNAHYPNATNTNSNNAVHGLTSSDLSAIPADEELDRLEREVTGGATSNSTSSLLPTAAGSVNHTNTDAASHKDVVLQVAPDDKKQG